MQSGIETKQYTTGVYIIEFELRNKEQNLNDRPIHRGNFIFNDEIDSKTDTKLLVKKLTGWTGHIKVHVALRAVHSVAEVLEMNENKPHYPWFQSLA